jgi:hypothetical protein
MTLIAINPANGAELARYDEHHHEQIEAALARAHAASRAGAIGRSPSAPGC